MAISMKTEKKVKKDFGRVEDGAYSARIVQLVDFGKQIETDWQTGEPKVYEDSGEPIVKHKLWINYEFPTETIEINGEVKPRWYGKEYTLSDHEKSSLYALVKAADPKGDATNDGTNLQGLLGLPVMVTIGSTRSNKAKVASVSAIPKGMVVDALSNPESSFDLDSGDLEMFKALPQWMQDRITSSIDFDKTVFYQVVNKKDISKADTSVY